MKKIKYHFFGKNCKVDNLIQDYSSLELHLKILKFNNQGQTLFLDQIHSNEVAVIDDPSKIYLPSQKPKADAIVTNIESLALGIVTADCVPIVLLDKINSVVGIVHAGWRGAKRGIISATVSKMIGVGAKKENISAIVGPSIRQEFYEVSNNFYQDFILENQNNSQFFVSSRQKNHFMFDLPGYVKSKLKISKINKITDQKLDTYSNPDIFHSYRRSCHLDEGCCGRNISIVSIS